MFTKEVDGAAAAEKERQKISGSSPHPARHGRPRKKRTLITKKVPKYTTKSTKEASLFALFFFTQESSILHPTFSSSD
jgi:hypothetical protein